MILVENEVSLSQQTPTRVGGRSGQTPASGRAPCPGHAQSHLASASPSHFIISKPTFSHNTLLSFAIRSASPSNVLRAKKILLAQAATINTRTRTVRRTRAGLERELRTRRRILHRFSNLNPKIASHCASGARLSGLVKSQRAFRRRDALRFHLRGAREYVFARGLRSLNTQGRKG